MERDEALARLARSPVARLGTITADKRPHIVPVTFAVVDESVLTMIDQKPKSTRALKRLSNLRHDSRATLIADHYEDDWSRLWWVRVDGEATIHPGGEIWETARRELAAKYRQYHLAPPEGPAIALVIERLSFWASTP
ncbi:MAG: TIGR03668 family PPOX class F420-dependent oxidoreductase [Acidimicrobiia bacterium]|nr:TIGR03668 family PPOX class F420-dependent oxidoreductase [Acidimicrobiia bacterium]